MHPNQTLSLFTTPFLLWSRLAWQTGEMAMASAQVIGQRTARPGFAGAAPGAGDLRELALMGREKSEAMLESAQAVYARMLALNRQFAELAARQMLSTWTGLMSVAVSRSLPESVERQSKLVRDMTTQAAVATSKLSGSTARLAKSAVKPVSTRVKRNARRLGRKSA